jgi:hypothetical protein
MVGTFDVENYGDLLFPLIAAAALDRRGRQISVVPFSVNGKSEASWPFQVRRVEDLAASLSSLSAMLIGGGQIVRFDQRYYPVPVPANVEMPVAYWLIPAVQAALAGKPVIWNAVGAWTGSPRAPWHDELLRQVFAASYLIGVRDTASRDYLARLAPGADIEFLPDTAFGLSRLWPLQEESAEFGSWRRALGVKGNYVVVQANASVGLYRSTIEYLVRTIGGTNAVILPVCWCHGDRTEDFPELKVRAFLSREWLGPRLISEIIGRSEFVFASSLHACITALSYGVPGARVPIYSDRKFELLSEFEGIVPIDNKEALSRLIHRGRRTEPRAVEYADRLDHYWDTVRDVVLDPPNEHCDRSKTLMLGWVATACGDRGRFGLTRRLAGTLRKSLARYFPAKWRVAIRHPLTFLENRAVTALLWDARAPIAQPKGDAELPPVSPERIPAGTRDRGAKRILNIPEIAQQKMESEPYQWAFIDRLFSAEDAARLAASFPCDKFKKVAGHDREKGYQYMSRSLIHLGAASPSYPEGLGPAWLAVAGDLLSAEYRSALTRITGRDLTLALMEVNVVHYGPGSWLGPHLDLKEKMVTHVLYFNESWDPQQGGCLNILRSSDPDDVVAEILPVVGNSVLLVRSNRSWHSVSHVVEGCRISRRSINVIFHLPGSVSTMWPPGRNPDLQDYSPEL